MEFGSAALHIVLSKCNCYSKSNPNLLQQAVKNKRNTVALRWYTANQVIIVTFVGICYHN